MAEPSDLIDALLAADTEERERLIRAAEASELEAALHQLGHRRELTAAEVLGLVDQVAEDRGVRKVARRELHRLRSMGVHPPEPTPTVGHEPEARQTERPPQIEAWATDIDPSGTRALWMLTQRPLGGIWFSVLLLNDGRGLEEMSLVDTTRKRFQRDFEAAQQHGTSFVSIPGDYALKLVREAVDLRREQSAGLPTRYLGFRDAFGEASGPPERALVYETISPMEVSLSPEWLDNSPRLLMEPEFRGWYIPAPAEFRARALDVARAPTSGLVVPGRTPEQDALQLLVDIGQAVMTPSQRRALRRRLEESAYIFASTDRPGAARMAAASARALEDSAAAPSAERHPLVRALLGAGVARLVASETVGGRRAPEILLHLFERAAGEYDAQRGAVETRPSGLILPR